MTKKYQIGLDEKTLDLVRQASGKDGMGGYVHSLVSQQHEKWTTAHGWLQENGWINPEIAAVCQLLTHRDLAPTDSLTDQMADSMSRAYENYATDFDISADRWEELTEQVRTSEPAALQLSILVEECANENRELLARLGLDESS